jgi:hypothetical protein
MIFRWSRDTIGLGMEMFAFGHFQHGFISKLNMHVSTASQ